MNRRVLVFDSGVGGLSVLQAIRQRLPALHFHYLADNARFPYGDLDEAEVVQRCCDQIDQALRAFPADIVVVACNTASTVVLPPLRERVSVPVVGVVPAIKPASALSENRRIGLLATPGTVRRPYLDQLIDEFAGDCQVVRTGSSELVRMAEAQIAGIEPERTELETITRPLLQAEVDTVVLGCTHFPLLQTHLQSCLPDVNHWVDSGAAIARRVEALLSEAMVEPTLFGGQSMPEFHFSGDIPANLPAYLARNGFPEAQIKTAQQALSGELR